ncbi:hypothetical protein GCM10009664_44150 [Kitasatospora gansuensis]
MDVLAPQVLVQVEGDVVVALHGRVEAGADCWFHLADPRKVGMNAYNKAAGKDVGKETRKAELV